MLAASISALAKPRCGEQIEARLIQFLSRDLQRSGQEINAERPFVEDEADVEGAGSAASTLSIAASVKPLARKRRVVDAGRLAERSVADGVGDDLGDLRLAIAERAQRLGHGAVDDLEIAAAGELLELHQREVGLDAGGVAIHHQADRAGRRDDGDLRVAVAVLLAERQRSRARRRARRRESPPRRRPPCRAKHGRAGSARRKLLIAVGQTFSGALWLRMTRSIASALGSWPGKAPSFSAISAEVA